MNIRELNTFMWLTETKTVLETEFVWHNFIGKHHCTAVVDEGDVFFHNHKTILFLKVY
jgi:hypothetical protein